MSLLPHTWTKAINDPTNIAKEIEISLIASAYILTLLALTFFWNSPNNLVTPLNISPNALKGEVTPANFSIILRNFLAISNIAMKEPITNNEVKSNWAVWNPSSIFDPAVDTKSTKKGIPFWIILPIVSNRPETNPLTLLVKTPAVFCIPFIRPNTMKAPIAIKTLEGDFIPNKLQNEVISNFPMFLIADITSPPFLNNPRIKPPTILEPIDMKTFEGEWIPNNLQKASIKKFPNCLIASTAEWKPEIIPFFIPSTILSPILFEDFSPSIQLKNLDIFSCKDSKTWFILSKSNRDSSIYLIKFSKDFQLISKLLISLIFSSRLEKYDVIAVTIPSILLLTFSKSTPMFKSFPIQLQNLENVSDTASSPRNALMQLYIPSINAWIILAVLLI